MPAEGERTWPRWRYLGFNLGIDLALRLFPKGRRDCRAHHWYDALGGDIQRCRYCEAGVRVIEPEERDPWRSGVRVAKELVVTDGVFAAMVDRVSFAVGDIGSEGSGEEALLLASWLCYREWAEAK